MSKSNEADLQRKEAIEKLKGERIELNEKLIENDNNTARMRTELYNKNQESNMILYEKIAIIDDQIKTLQAPDPSQV